MVPNDIDVMMTAKCLIQMHWLMSYMSGVYRLHERPIRETLFLHVSLSEMSNSPQELAAKSALA